MIEHVHNHITSELQQNTRTDIIFIISAILLNLITLAINISVAYCTGKKIAVVIGEQHSQGWARTGQSAYGPLIEELNGQFKKLGLKTYSPEEIKQQVAQAEQEAFLANNLEAAVSAAGRLSADFMIRGIISTKIQKNPFVGIDEVFVTLSLTLVDRDGQNISSSTLSEAMFSDADTVATVHKLVREKAEQIIVNLYSECCKGLSGK